MKQTIPLPVYILTIILLLIIFWLFLSSRDAKQDARIIQLRDSVQFYDRQARLYIAAADSADALAEFYSKQAMTAVRETILIDKKYATTRDSITSLSANNSIRLLAKNLKGE